MGTIDIRDLDDVEYLGSNVTQQFKIKAINDLYKDKFEELLANENIGNGSLRAHCINGYISFVSYETTDNYEFAESFTVDVAEAITIAIAKLRQWVMEGNKL